jgi:hypothetical protein
MEVRGEGVVLRAWRIQDVPAVTVACQDDEIARLREEIRSAHPVSATGEIDQLRSENERLTKQVQLVRQEAEAKLERLNARVRELSGAASPAPAAGSEADRKGFFRR